MCILAPGKWSVVLAKNRRRCDIVDALSLKLISDQDSCVEFVCLIDLLLSQVADTWNVFVNIVCMGRTVARDISSCLRPRCRPGRVGMHDTANIRETVVKYHVGRRIGRRVVLALDLIALQIHNDHIFRCQFVIIYTARLDYKKSCLPVDTTDIAPGKCHQLIFWQKHICLINFSF